MRKSLFIFFAFIQISIYAQEKVYQEQIGNQIGLRTDDSTIYKPIVVFKGKELELKHFEHAYFSPNRELVAIKTRDTQLKNAIVLYDYYGNPVKRLITGPVGNILINNYGEMVISEITGTYPFGSNTSKIIFYNHKNGLTTTNSPNFVSSPSMYFLNDSIVLVYGSIINNPQKNSVEWVFPSKYFLLVFVNFIETGRKSFSTKGFKTILPSITQKKPELTGNLIKVFSNECVYDSDIWFNRTIRNSKCDSITLYFNLNAEIIRREEKW